jgi:hypothetical protein
VIKVSITDGSSSSDDTAVAGLPFLEIDLLQSAPNEQRITAVRMLSPPPTEQDLKIALDVVEGILAPIFGHKDAAEKLADRVPPRASKPSKQ